MTPTQFSTLLAAVRQVDERIQAVEDRLAWVYPTDDEMRRSIDSDIERILGCGVTPFAD